MLEQEQVQGLWEGRKQLLTVQTQENENHVSSINRDLEAERARVDELTRQSQLVARETQEAVEENECLAREIEGKRKELAAKDAERQKAEEHAKKVEEDTHKGKCCAVQ
eukprot:NODE_8907_length_1460_cov_11.475619.p7 GENE.NODE_8907_length_1460_cov_11.475619~~NODE_8907_length_1460_cov_11.475619.p7  ORF type:complete len:109 (-),score=36.43 NODE_8907_length_1460_cov_11.475619:547-873(-)